MRVQIFLLKIEKTQSPTPKFTFENNYMIIGKYRLGKTIGKGSFSVVKLGYHVSTKDPVAIKIVEKQNLKNSPDKYWLKREMNILKKLDHPGICKFIDFIKDMTSYYLVTEYCGGGELYDFIITHHPVEEKLAKKFFKQIVLILSYIHSKGICHRDLKPENLLLTESNTIKLIDFGLSSESSICTDKVGSPIYVAPETLFNDTYDGKIADIWSLGVVLYTLVTGQIPWDYKNEKAMYEQIKNGDYYLPNGLSKDCLNLIKSILNPNPKHRITLERILAHEWLIGVENPFQTNNNNDVFLGTKGSINSYQSFEFSKKLPISRNGGYQSPRYGQNNKIAHIVFNSKEKTPNKSRRQSYGKNNATHRTQTHDSNRPRSISFSSTMTNEYPDNVYDKSIDEMIKTHRGPIISRTITQKDPQAIAQQFDSYLKRKGITFKHKHTLLFHIHFLGMDIDAEICRLLGFRKLYVISFKRIKGESLEYANFVSSLIGDMKREKI